MASKEKAAALYAAYRAFLDKNKIAYDRADDELRLVFAVRGEESVLKLSVSIDAEAEMTLISAPLAFVADSARIMDLMIAANAVNAALAPGKFFINADTAETVYALQAHYGGLDEFGGLYAGQVLFGAFNAVELYADRLADVAKGKLTVKEFVDRYGNTQQA